MREENPFKEERCAQEWSNIIDAYEARNNDSRSSEVYPYLRQWAGSLKPGVVVEIGSGQGVCSDKLGDFGGRYIGVEPSQYLVKRARELYGHHPNREFVEGDAYVLPLEDGIADAAFSVCVWFHIKDLDRAAKELARILKSGGEFVIISGHPEMYELWKTFFEDDLEVHEDKLVGTMKLTGGAICDHLYTHTKEDLYESLERNELVVDEEGSMGYGEEHQDMGIFILLRGHKK